LHRNATEGVPYSAGRRILAAALLLLVQLLIAGQSGH
jgi:hypothetical protein